MAFYFQIKETFIFHISLQIIGYRLNLTLETTMTNKMQGSGLLCVLDVWRTTMVTHNATKNQNEIVLLMKLMIPFELA